MEFFASALFTNSVEQHSTAAVVPYMSVTQFSIVFPIRSGMMGKRSFTTQGLPGPPPLHLFDESSGWDRCYYWITSAMMCPSDFKHFLKYVIC